MTLLQEMTPTRWSNDEIDNATFEDETVFDMKLEMSVLVCT